MTARGESVVPARAFTNHRARHPVSRNASKSKPAKLLAVSVVETDDKELTTPVK